MSEAADQGRNAWESWEGETAHPWLLGLTVERAVWLFLALGVAARVVRFALRFPLWEDEAFLGANFIGASYRDLFQPLGFNQVCPLLFLWIELTMVKLFGFTEYSLRLFPLISSVASLFVFRHLAGRLLQGLSLVVAVAIFSVAYPGIRYAAEVKPYGTDLLVATVLVALTVEWITEPQRQRWLWLLAAVAPLAVGLSFPAVFVGGAMSLVIAYARWTRRASGGWLPWIAYNAALVGSFVALFLLSAREQSIATAEAMSDHWLYSFPPLGQPLRLLGWLVTTHTGYLLAYPIGGRSGASTLTFVCCAMGLVVWWRQGRRPAILLAVLPFALTFVAAALHRYPYGGHMRMTLHLAPGICLLAGAGAAALLARLSVRRPTPVHVALVVLAAIGLASMGRDLWLPGKSRADIRARSVARQLWQQLSATGQVLCIGTDATMAPLYLCNRHIYLPADASTALLHPDRVAANRPLHCVQMKSTLVDHDEAAFQQWLTAMSQSYMLTGHEEHFFMDYGGLLTYYDAQHNKCQKQRKEYIEVYSFVPKRDLTQEAISVATALSEPLWRQGLR